MSSEKTGKLLAYEQITL